MIRISVPVIVKRTLKKSCNSGCKGNCSGFRTDGETDPLDLSEIMSNRGD